MARTDAPGFWMDGVRQKCLCGDWLPDDGSVHPRCRMILKDGLGKVWNGTLRDMPKAFKKKVRQMNLV
jgi:hypothetical protein